MGVVMCVCAQGSVMLVNLRNFLLSSLLIYVLPERALMLSSLLILLGTM